MSFKWNDSTITARGDLTIGDEDRIGGIMGKLPDDTQAVRAYNFGEFMVAANVEGESPVPLVSEDDDAETVNASYEVWRKLPRRFGQQWRLELQAAENPSPKK